jgi:hypothetical protein
MRFPRRVRIISTGPVYSTINATDCLSWPSEEIKGKAGEGEGGWGNFYPSIGDEGEVIWASRHCDQPVTVYLLDLGDYFVPIGERGIEFLDGEPPSAAVLSARCKGRQQE